MSQSSRAPAELGLDLEDDPVLVELGEHRGHLPLAEGVVQGVVDRLRTDPEPRGGAAVDHQRGAESLILLVGADVGQLAPRAQRVDQAGGPEVELAPVRILEAVLVLRAAHPILYGEVLPRLHEELDAVDLSQRGL